MGNLDALMGDSAAVMKCTTALMGYIGGPAVALTEGRLAEALHRATYLVKSSAGSREPSAHAAIPALP